MSHQLGVHGVHQIDTNSTLVLLLGLKPSAKARVYTKASCHLAVLVDLCGRAGSGESSKEAKEFMRPK